MRGGSYKGGYNADRHLWTRPIKYHWPFVALSDEMVFQGCRRGLKPFILSNIAVHCILRENICIDALNKIPASIETASHDVSQEIIQSAEMFFIIIFSLQEGLSWQLIHVLFLFFANKGCNPSTSVGMRISCNWGKPTYMDQPVAMHIDPRFKS